jgi:hypothetical protein
MNKDQISTLTRRPQLRSGLCGSQSRDREGAGAFIRGVFNGAMLP